MYISCIELNTASLEVLRLLNSPYRTHAAVERAFAPGTERANETERILWRVDDQSDASIVRLYIASPAAPDLNEWASTCDLPSDAVVSALSKDYRPLLNRIQNGSVWNFRLKANPVRRVAVDKGRRKNSHVVGKVQGHVTVEQQMTWLLERSESHGFKVTDYEGAPNMVISNRCRETFQRAGKTVTLTTAQYDGVLEVVDAELFRIALCSGIGRAKGFGCGLLTVVPMS